MPAAAASTPPTPFKGVTVNTTTMHVVVAILLIYTFFEFSTELVPGLSFRVSIATLRWVSHQKRFDTNLTE